MRILRTLSDLRDWRSGRGGPVVLVPTMGALHEGHLALLHEARRIAGADGGVIASIFVNPLQFGPAEDYAKYPRELEADLEKCREANADAVFAPSLEEMYVADRSVMVLETRLSKLLCGASRPGHFDGVCTVVLKLFNLVQPHTAVFGKKDWQQLAIIRRMARDLDVNVGIAACDTVREPDGLALSSRNRYLGGEERRQAPAIRQGLALMRERWGQGERDAARLKSAFAEHLAARAPSGRIDYVACVNRDTLESANPVDGNGLFICAVFFGTTRLIDNLEAG